MCDYDYTESDIMGSRRPAFPPPPVMRHLWEAYHPYYGAEGTLIEFESLAELIETATDYDADMNHVYRWDWSVPDPDDYTQGEEMPPETLTLYVVMPRKSRFTNWSCPVSRDQEEQVREFLLSPRVLGALKLVWAPLLDGAQ